MRATRPWTSTNWNNVLIAHLYRARYVHGTTGRLGLADSAVGAVTFYVTTLDYWNFNRDVGVTMETDGMGYGQLLQHWRMEISVSLLSSHMMIVRILVSRRPWIEVRRAVCISLSPHSTSLTEVPSSLDFREPTPTEMREL